MTRLVGPKTGIRPGPICSSSKGRLRWTWDTPRVWSMSAIKSEVWMVCPKRKQTLQSRLCGVARSKCKQTLQSGFQGLPSLKRKPTLQSEFQGFAGSKCKATLLSGFQGLRVRGASKPCNQDSKVLQRRSASKPCNQDFANLKCSQHCYQDSRVEQS